VLQGVQEKLVVQVVVELDHNLEEQVIHLQ
jgi:hypothetical protein